jgi:adenylate kinase
MSPNKQFILLGPPGSGKGTQAKFLAAKLRVPHISTGEIFRDHISRQTDLGKEVDNILKQGLLVSDDITNKIVADRLNQADAVPGFVLDGYPRNLVQAAFLNESTMNVQALDLELSDDEAVKRISRRWTCSVCGAIYHLDFKPPQNSGICDIDNTPLSQRSDQAENIVRDRLVIYHKQTEPLLAYYKREGRLIVIDGTPPIPQVTENINKVLQI